MREVEEGEEVCPICRKINNPGAQEFSCSHIICLQWEGDLTWTDGNLQEVIDLVDSIKDLLSSEEDEIKEESGLYGILSPDYYSTADSIQILLGDNLIAGNPIENETYLSSGSGTLWYLSKMEVLDEIIETLTKFKLDLLETKK
jgi:hypothetical protein